MATRDEHVYGSNPKWARNLRIFGEACVTKEGKDSKTDDQGEAMMLVGYPFNREVDSMRMWNPYTNRVIISRDVLWPKHMFYVASKISEPLKLEDDAQADGAVDEDEASVSDDGTDTVSENGDEDESSNRESIAGGTVTNDATVTSIGQTVRPIDRIITGFQATAVESWLR